MQARLLFTAALAGVAIWPLGGAAFETQASHALVVDHATGAALFEKDADTAAPTASMSKLMTLYMLFEAIDQGRVTLDTTFEVSARAHAMGGSRMFLEIGEQVRVDDLIRGIIVQSGNDACVVVAEGLAGTEETFAKQMNARAAALGLTHTNLTNSSGWPEPGHVMSARDLVELSRRIIDEFPDFYEYFKETEFTWNGISQPNRNPLLTLGIGADGLKTGHTVEAGYGLVGSAVQNGQRIVFMVNGLDGVSERAAETTSLVKWAYGAFDTVRFFSEGDVVVEADVWLGEDSSVPLIAPRDLQMLVERERREGLKAEIRYAGPIEAPIAEGQALGELVVMVPGNEPVSFDLVAGASVPRGGIMTRLNAATRLARERVTDLLPQGQ